MKEHFHLPPDAEVTIETFYERLHPDDRERTRQAIETSIQKREAYDIEYRTVSPDGTRTTWLQALGISASFISKTVEPSGLVMRLVR